MLCCSVRYAVNAADGRSGQHGEAVDGVRAGREAISRHKDTEIPNWGVVNRYILLSSCTRIFPNSRGAHLDVKVLR